MSSPSVGQEIAQAYMKNAWWGVGVIVETQLGICAMETTLAYMQSFDDPWHCYVRINKVRVGPGIGGGGDGAIFLASNVPTPYDFTKVEIDTGWGISVKVPEASSKGLGNASKILNRLRRRLPTVQLRRMVKGGMKHSGEAKDLISDLKELYGGIAGTANGKPTLWSFPVGGGGVEIAAYREMFPTIEPLNMGFDISKLLP